MLQGVTRGYRRSQGVTRGNKEFLGLQEVTRGYMELQGVTEGLLESSFHNLTHILTQDSNSKGRNSPSTVLLYFKMVGLHRGLLRLLLKKPFSPFLFFLAKADRSCCGRIFILIELSKRCLWSKSRYVSNFDSCLWIFCAFSSSASA